MVHALPGHLVARGDGSGGWSKAIRLNHGDSGRRTRDSPTAACCSRDVAADIFIFDPERLALGRRHKEVDRVTGTPRFRSSVNGVRATIVNGQVVIDDGVPTGLTPGQVVRPR